MNYEGSLSSCWLAAASKAVSEDPISARAEYFGEFRDDIAEYLPLSALMPLVVRAATQIKHRVEFVDSIEYWVANVTMMVPGVHAGSKGPTLYTANELMKAAPLPESRSDMSAIRGGLCAGLLASSPFQTPFQSDKKGDEKGEF